MRTSSLRSKLLTGAIGLVVGFVLLTLTILYALISQFADREIGKNLAAGRKAYERYINLKQHLLRDKADSLGKLPYLAATLGIEDVDRETVKSALQDVQQSSGAALLVIADAKGALLATSLTREIFPQDLTAMPGISRVLQGELGEGLWSGHGLYFVAASPVVVGEQMVGMVIVGERIDAVAAREIADVTGHDVVVSFDDRVIVAASHNAGGGGVEVTGGTDLGQLVGQPSSGSGSHTLVVIGGEEHVALAMPLHGDIGSLILARASREIMGLHRQAWTWILAAGLLVAAIGILYSLHLSRRLTLPVQKLDQASRQLAAGDFTANVAVESNDEIGRLALAFNVMARRIEDLVGDVRAKALKAETANHAKDRFLASVSHELRTPLTNIQAYSEILMTMQDGESETEEKEFLDIIGTESERLAGLISKVLEFATVELDQDSWSVETVNIRKLVRVAAKRVIDEAREDKSVRIMAVCEDDDVPYPGDEARLVEVFRHLLENAWHFSPDGKDVLVSIDRHDDGVEIQVCDEGPGVPGDEQKAAVFEMFHQCGDILTDKPAGIGVGLAITREVVEVHGGTIECRDNDGGGAVFVVRLPYPRPGEKRPIDELPSVTGKPTD